MRLFNELDLKTGLSPPEGFEMANGRLRWARERSGDMVTLRS